MCPPASAVAPLSVALSEIDAPTLTDCSAEVEIEVGCLSTTKHSEVVFVWFASRYFEPWAAVNSTRKQYAPTAVGVKASEVALPPDRVFVAPTFVPPVEQSGAEPDGPQTKKATVPLTVPLGPVSVAVSVTDWPIVMWPLFPVLEPSCLTWVRIVCWEQNDNVQPAKSDSVGLPDCEERVSAMNEVKQPWSSPSAVRS